MIKIKVLSIGKTKEQWLEEAIQEYIKRLQAVIHFEFVWARDNSHLVELANKEQQCICLDPKGTMYTSNALSSYLQMQWEQGGSRLSFVIGGPEGLPEELKTKGPLLSLSPLTFTHQITRLILIEQIYRAVEIQKGSHYHK